MPVTTYCTDLELKTAVAEAMGQLVDELASRWDGIVQRANPDAYYLILRKMAERGYSKVEIDSWVEAKTFNIDIGMLFVLQRGGVLNTFSDTFIRSIDRRKELESAMIIDSSGNFIYPSGAGQEAVTGAMDYTGYDFNPAVEFTFTDAMRQPPGTEI